MIELTPDPGDLFPKGGPLLLVGTGPSLDTFNRWDDYPSTIALNETVLVAPNAIGLAWDGDPVRRIGWVLKKDGLPPPFMLVEEDIYAGRRGKGTGWVRDYCSYFNRLQCKKECCRIGTASVAVGIADRFGIKEIHTVGMEGFWWWRRVAESPSDRPDPSKAPDGTFGCSEAVQAILRRVDGTLANRGGPQGAYVRIARAFQSAATSRGIELKEA